MEYMDRKSKMLLVVIVITILFSIGMTFYETVVLHNFEVVNVVEEAEGE